jgi:hypothetical protein
MPPLVVTGAMCACTFGVAPSALMVLPTNMVLAGSLPAASVQDNIAMTNIMPFGMCITPSNPQVAAATAAALGVLTPQPCIPIITGPWTPGATKVQIRGAPALHNACICMCAWGGVVSITSPGQFLVQVI